MSKHLCLLAGLALLCATSRTIAQPLASIIPQPVSTQWGQGQFSLNANTVIVADPADKPSVQFFNDYLQKLYGLHLSITAAKPTNNYIALAHSTNSAQEGSYHLDAAPDHVQITAATGNG